MSVSIELSSLSSLRDTSGPDPPFQPQLTCETMSNDLDVPSCETLPAPHSACLIVFKQARPLVLPSLPRSIVCHLIRDRLRTLGRVDEYGCILEHGSDDLGHRLSTLLGVNRCALDQKRGDRIEGDLCRTDHDARMQSAPCTKKKGMIASDTYEPHG